MKNFRSIFTIGLAISLFVAPTVNLRANSDNSWFGSVFALGAIGTWIGGCFAFKKYQKSQRETQRIKNKHVDFLNTVKSGDVQNVNIALQDPEVAQRIDSLASALTCAVRNKNEPVVRSLLAAKASPEGIFRYGAGEQVQLLITAGASVNNCLPNSFGYTPLTTPLIVAADSGNVGSVKALVEAKASVHHQGYSGTAALYAASAGHDSVVKYLIDEAGVSVAELDNYNRPYIYNWSVYRSVNRYCLNKALEQAQQKKVQRAQQQQAPNPSEKTDQKKDE